MTAAERAEQDRFMIEVAREVLGLPADAVADIVREETGGKRGAPVRLVRRRRRP
jgi:hypothetical protein